MEVTVEHTKHEHGYSCYIPDHDIFFSYRKDDDIEGIKRKAQIMVKIWIEQHLKVNQVMA